MSTHAVSPGARPTEPLLAVRDLSEASSSRHTRSASRFSSAATGVAQSASQASNGANSPARPRLARWAWPKAMKNC